MSERLTDYERQTQELINHLEEERTAIQERMDNIQLEIEDVDRKLNAVKTALLVFREQNDIVRTDANLRELLKNLSVRDMILKIAEVDNTPTFRANDICKRLVEAGMFSNVGQAADNVYSVIGRSKTTFTKRGKGVYQIAKAATTESSTARPGLVREVERMLALQPELTRKQLTEALIEEGWDFGGKNPTYAVSMAYAKAAQNRKRGRITEFPRGTQLRAFGG